VLFIIYDLRSPLPNRHHPSPVRSRYYSNIFSHATHANRVNYRHDDDDDVDDDNINNTTLFVITNATTLRTRVVIDSNVGRHLSLRSAETVKINPVTLTSLVFLALTSPYGIRIISFGPIGLSKHDSQKRATSLLHISCKLSGNVFVYT